ncbi:MAG: hypothetical protein E5V89_25360 [Mesorhizobium sp.]|nr:MAG: hypothetical protein E5V89_25360 [Mesorhizobium sp.]
MKWRLEGVRAVQRLAKSLDCSNYLFFRNCERKTATHCSWNCSRARQRKRCRCPSSRTPSRWP